MGDLTTVQAGQALGLTRDTVSAYAQQGRFPSAYKLGAGGPWRIPERDLDEFRQSMRPTTTDLYGFSPSSPRARAARKAAATRRTA